MFDISFFELLVIAVVGLFVIGPERLPTTIRTVALWIGRIKRSILETRREIEQQLGADEIRRELHNEQVMRNWEKMKDTRTELEAKIKALSSGQTIEHDSKPALGADSTGSEPAATDQTELSEGTGSAAVSPAADPQAAATAHVASPPAGAATASAAAGSPAAGSPAAGSPAAASAAAPHNIRSYPPAPDDKTGSAESSSTKS